MQTKGHTSILKKKNILGPTLAKTKTTIDTGINERSKGSICDGDVAPQQPWSRRSVCTVCDETTEL